MNTPDQTSQRPDADDSFTQKVDEFEGDAKVRVAVWAGVVLGFLFCCVVVVAVVTMASSGNGISPSANTPGGANEPGSFEIIIPVAADSYVDQKERLERFGSEKTMRLARNGNSACYPVLRFALPDLSKHSIKSVDLMLTPTREWGDAGPQFKVVACGVEWEEAMVNFATAPKSTVLLGFFAGGAEGDGAELRIPLDAHGLAESSLLGMQLDTPSLQADRSFLTREAGAQAPALVMVVEGIGPPPAPPAPPPPLPASGTENPLPDPGSDNTAPPGTAPPPLIAGQWKRVFYESFEIPNVDEEDEASDPAGWKSEGHPNYQHLTDENSGRFSTPYGFQGLSSYTVANAEDWAYSLTSRDILNEPLTKGARYLLTFNVAANAGQSAAFYRVQLVAIDDSTGSIRVLADLAARNDGQTDMSDARSLLFKAGDRHTDITGHRVAIRMGMDPDYASKKGKHTQSPVFDNVVLYVEKPVAGN